jgi:hypothetical protein
MCRDVKEGLYFYVTLKNLFYMKRTFTFKFLGLALMMMTGLSSLHAQDESYNSEGRFGVRAGVLISKQNFDEGNLAVDPKSKFGADLAILYTLPIGDGFFALQPELHWMQKGSTIEDIGGTGDDVTNTLNYLELPVLLRFNFGGSLKLFAIGGPSMGFFLGGTSDGNDLEKDDFEDIEWGLHLGAGIGLGAFEVDIRYLAGLSDINAVEGDLTEVKNSAFGAGLTYKF